VGNIAATNHLEITIIIIDGRSPVVR